MPKHRQKESFRSLFGSRIDPQKCEELKRAKTEIEVNMQKMSEIEGNMQKISLALGDDNNDGKEQLVNLIKEFHKHYQLLYESFTHLTEELRMKADKKNGTDSSSSSDSDEMEKLHREYQTALSKMQEALNTIREYNSEAEKWNDEISRLPTENTGVETKLELEEIDLKERALRIHEHWKEIATKLITENKIQILETELGSDQNAPSGSIDKSRVLDVLPLRYLVPVFPNPSPFASSASNPQGNLGFGSRVQAPFPLNSFRPSPPHESGSTSGRRTEEKKKRTEK